MTSFKKALVIAIALPMALGSASALASGGGKHHGGKGGCGMQDGRKVFSQLDLTDAQKEQMKSMKGVEEEIDRLHKEGMKNKKIQEEILTLTFSLQFGLSWSNTSKIIPTSSTL